MQQQFFRRQCPLGRTRWYECYPVERNALHLRHRHLAVTLSALILPRLPRRPYCTNDLSRGLRIRSADDARHFRYLQINPHVLKHWLVFDIDYPCGGFSWERSHVAPPNLFCTNPANGHAHLAYLLSTPVVTSELARETPLRYAASVETAYALALRSDRAFGGLITKNPLHSAWKTLFLHAHAYELGELADWVVLPRRPPRRDSATWGLGRNVQLFDELRTWAYNWVRTYRNNDATLEQWYAALLHEAAAMNSRFSVPLGFSEVCATTKSIARWTWRQFTEERFRAIQRARGRKSGVARRKNSAEERKPWLTEGISRSTYCSGPMKY